MVVIVRSCSDGHHRALRRQADLEARRRPRRPHRRTRPSRSSSSSAATTCSPRSRRRSTGQDAGFEATPAPRTRARLRRLRRGPGLLRAAFAVPGRSRGRHAVRRPARRRRHPRHAGRRDLHRHRGLSRRTSCSTATIRWPASRCGCASRCATCARRPTRRSRRQRRRVSGDRAGHYGAVTRTAALTVQALPVEPKPPSPRDEASKLRRGETRLHHRHDHQLRERSIGCSVNARRCRVPAR